MSQQISLYIDVQNRQLVRSNSTTIPTTLPDVFQGDTVELYLEFLSATGSNAAPYTDIDFSSAAVIVAVGTIGAQPTAGYFTITDPAATQTTGTLPFNATAAAVQSAIQANLTTNWSTATVTGNAGGPYTITNGSTGAETALLGTSVSLTPASSVSIGTIQTGTSTLPQIHFVEVVQNPIALQDSWTAYPAPTATVTELQTGSGTQNEIQQITLGNNPYAGAFAVNFGGHTSNPIQWNATAATVQTTLQAMSSIGSGNVMVGGSAGAWVVTFTGTLALASQSLMTTVASGLVGPLALTGSLSLNTAAIEEAIGESVSISETFAIRVTPSGGSAVTVLQDTITIYNDLIVGAPSVPTPGVSYYTTAESDARYPLLSGSHIPLSYLAFPGTLAISTGKTFTADNTLTLSGTDGSTLNIGTGGTLGTGAYAAEYTLPDATSSTLGGVIVGTGLNVTSGTVAVDTQLANFQALGSPGTNGYVLSSTTGGTLSWAAAGHATIGTNATSYLTIASDVLSFVNSINTDSGLTAWDSSGNLTNPANTWTIQATGAVAFDSVNITSDGSGNLTVQSLLAAGTTIVDSSAQIYYPNGHFLTDASNNLYANITAGKLLASGGTGSPTTGITVGSGLAVSAGTLSVNKTYAVASGTNTYTATLSPALASYATGLIVTITFTNANTAASTLNLNSLGAKTIQLNGSAVTSGQIVANSTIQLVYDGTQFQIIT